MPLLVHAGISNGVVNLSDINGQNGFVINGVSENDYSGRSLGHAGDVNGDGFDDVIIGAQRADVKGTEDVGSTYVVYGSDLGLPSPLNLTDLNGENGIVIHGVSQGYESGSSVSYAGDVNGDGVDDLIIGIPESTFTRASAYVVFGSKSGLPSPINLADINSVNGFVIKREVNKFWHGSSVSHAGDINGDGTDDLIIGISGADANGIENAGNAYVVYGNNSGFPNPLNLPDLDGNNGFIINGVASWDITGSSVSNAGDVNADGFDDLIIGAPWANYNESINAGKAYVVFGNDSGLPNPLNLADLNGVNGFVINGINSLDQVGQSVSNAGDINGDGIDDMLIGSLATENDGKKTFVVFGSDSELPNPLNLDLLNGNNGFVLVGGDGDLSGESVSFAGDVNSDGIDDIIIGSRRGNSQAGKAYVVYGSVFGLPNPLYLADLNGNNGFFINGVNQGDLAGDPVSYAGDVNGDGVDDLIVGAPYADANENIDAGSSYVVYGLGDIIFQNDFDYNLISSFIWQ